MKKYKQQSLKEMVKLNVLARLCEIQPSYLSKIINNHVKPSQDLAERLAVAANILCGSADYFTAADFLTAPRRGKDD